MKFYIILENVSRKIYSTHLSRSSAERDLRKLRDEQRYTYLIERYDTEDEIEDYQ